MSNDCNSTGYTINFSNAKQIKIEFGPKGWQGSGFEPGPIKLKSASNEFANKMLECQTPSELSNMLNDEICIERCLIDAFEYLDEDVKKQSNEQILKVLKELADNGTLRDKDCSLAEYEYYGVELEKQFKKIKSSLSKLKHLDDVQSITISERYLSYCSELIEAMWSFMGDIDEELQCCFGDVSDYEEDRDEKVEELKDMLKEKFTEKEIKDIVAIALEERCAEFEGIIETTIDLKTKTVERNYRVNVIW